MSYCLQLSANKRQTYIYACRNMIICVLGVQLKWRLVGLAVEFHVMLFYLQSVNYSM